jgi:hypothetical protein
VNAADTSILALDKTAIEAARARLDSYREKFEALPCETVEQEQWWAAQLESAVAAKKKAQAEKEVVKRPVLRDSQAIDKAFKPVLKAAEDFEELCRSKLAAAATRRLEADAEAHRQLQAAAASGDMEAVGLALEAAPEAQKVGGVYSVPVYTWAVEDMRLVPLELMWPLDKLVQNRLKETKGADIPGMRITRTAEIRRTGKTGGEQ